MKPSIFIASGLLIITVAAWATTLPKVPVERLFADADFVGLVQVVASHTLGVMEESCGAIYTGQIIEQFKGASAQTIEFGHFFGLETGTRYLVFLTKPGTIYRPLASTNSISEGARDEYLARCQDKLSAWNVMHSGFGVMALDGAEPFNYADAFAVATRYVVFPDSIAAQDDEFGSKYEFTAMRWLSKDQVLAYLKGLSK